MDFSNMEVTIDHIADAGAKIKAYATVTFDGMFKVHGVRRRIQAGAEHLHAAESIQQEWQDTVHGCFPPHHVRSARSAQGSSHRRLQKSDEIKSRRKQ